jgi:outer membrane protein OmpA-like peptidoglycan-associated protein
MVKTRLFPCAALLVAACSQPVAFRGEQTLKVSAAAPAAPVATVEPPRVELRDNRIVIHEKVQFEWNQATILPVSFGLLDQVATVIKQNPHIKKLQVEGHASADGNARHNQQLSEDRARSVMKYLIDKGVAQSMLSSKGFGIDRPIADNESSQGREQNRRVEFNIVDQDVTQRRVEIDKSGKEKVLEEKQGKASS